MAEEAKDTLTMQQCLQPKRLFGLQEANRCVSSCIMLGFLVLWLLATICYCYHRSQSKASTFICSDLWEVRLSGCSDLSAIVVDGDDTPGPSRKFITEESLEVGPSKYAEVLVASPTGGSAVRSAVTAASGEDLMKAEDTTGDSKADDGKVWEEVTNSHSPSIQHLA